MRSHVYEFTTSRLCFYDFHGIEPYNRPRFPLFATLAMAHFYFKIPPTRVTPYDNDSLDGIFVNFYLAVTT